MRAGSVALALGRLVHSRILILRVRVCSPWHVCPRSPNPLSAFCTRVDMPVAPNHEDFPSSPPPPQIFRIRDRVHQNYNTYLRGNARWQSYSDPCIKLRIHERCGTQLIAPRTSSDRAGEDAKASHRRPAESEGAKLITAERKRTRTRDQRPAPRTAEGLIRSR